MDKLVIEGGRKLQGTVPISGSKNAALPILIASILCSEKVYLHNIPQLRDIETTLRLMTLLGCKATREQDKVLISPCDLTWEAPYDLVRTMRASVLCLGPLLGRLGKAKVALPGGCAIGTRPVDLHLSALEKMGASFSLEEGYIVGSCKQLHGTRITFDFPTVGGTENLLMAASVAKGETILENAAREPEIVDLANFLNACGANIQGHGTSVISIQGVPKLKGCEYSVMGDRIEAGTYMVAAAITNGELILKDCPLSCLDAVSEKLQEMGISIEQVSQGTLVHRTGPLTGVDIRTQPYPGFPTDMQAQLMALMCIAEGSGMIRENIFENRFMHVQELMRMGAKIKISENSALVRGVSKLKGAPVMASDLRASASLVLAGLAAQGQTQVRRIYHLDRGYEHIEDKLSAVGAKVWREKE